MNNFQEIKNNFIDIFFLFQIKDKKNVFLFKSDSKSKLKQKLKEFISKNEEKYKNTNYLLLSIKFRDSTTPDLVHGDLFVYVKPYNINLKMKLKSTTEDNNYIIFYKDWLEDNGWDNQYLQKIVNVIAAKKITFQNPLSMPNYTDVKYK
jgi:hypothetical protein